MGLIWLIVGGVALWALVRLGRQTERPGRGQWRVSATLVAAAFLGGGALALARGAWLIGGALIAAGLYLAFASRIRAAVRSVESGMSVREARDTLGVGADATVEQINAAWKRLMARAHPDQGGTQGLASRLNAARDRLLKG
ncbi:molecular chaperone DnaJ [Brevundimonas sp.]|uniref:molecular chaperone DnaJ n=1 Tax=Brevundimonas sp. TaxID=1871086 RepID=UPI001D6AE8B6|nr:molecular chaperone DnaJ [Brevundimonas sp.]MBA4000677.1 molecular chaperone DnaJ [Brevundimonas sp.]